MSETGEWTGTEPAAPTQLLGRAADENFPVASRLLPQRIRRHLMALYGFARLVDETGDEAPGDRLRRLDQLEADLDRVYAGEPRHPLLRALAPTVRELDLPRQPFARLIAANRMDQLVARYPTLADLLGYCELSANPVGHLVLHVFGAATPARLALSDAVCTGLQLIEHWQDVAEDYRRGRVYVPQQDLMAYGVPETDLSAGRATPALRQLLAMEAARAADLLARGAPLVRTLPAGPRLATAGFIGGGRAALAALAAVDHDVLAHPARPRRSRRLRETLRVLALRR